MKKISVIIASYNEEENIKPLYERLVKVSEKLPFVFEFIWVDNDSTDNSEKILASLAKRDKRVKAIFMSRNFGSPQPSFLAGMKNARGDAVVLLQGDIQDPPEVIPSFIKEWEKGNEVVYGIRTKREGYGVFKNFLYKLFYYVFSKLSYLKIPLEVGDFSLLDKVVVINLINFGEYDYYIRGLRSYVGYKQAGVKYVREKRRAGKSNENFLSSLWWAKTIIINFSLRPLELISKLAFLVMLLTMAAIIINITLVLVVRGSPPGIPTILIVVLFLGGIQLLSLSIIAEYLAKMFLEIKGRPKYIIKKKINI